MTTGRHPSVLAPLASPAVDVNRSGKSLRLSSPQVLGDFPPHLGHHLRRWAAVAPDRVFLAERTPQGFLAAAHLWPSVGFGAASGAEPAGLGSYAGHPGDGVVRRHRQSGTAQAGCHAGGHPLCAGLARLLADVAGVRQAQIGVRTDPAWLGVCGGSASIRARARCTADGRTRGGSSAPCGTDGSAVR